MPLIFDLWFPPPLIALFLPLPSEFRDRLVFDLHHSSYINIISCNSPVTPEASWNVSWASHNIDHVWIIPFGTLRVANSLPCHLPCLFSNAFRQIIDYSKYRNTVVTVPSVSPRPYRTSQLLVRSGRSGTWWSSTWSRRRACRPAPARKLSISYHIPWDYRVYNTSWSTVQIGEYREIDHKFYPPYSIPPRWV